MRIVGTFDIIRILTYLYICCSGRIIERTYFILFSVVVVHADIGIFRQLILNFRKTEQIAPDFYGL